MRRLLFLVLILSSVGAWAEDYYWVLIGKDGRYSSPESACRSYEQDAWGDGSMKFRRIEKVSDVRFNCFVRLFYADGSSGPQNYQIGYASRRGDSCPAGTEYNPETGSCDQDCSATLGDGATSFFTGATRPTINDPFPSPESGIEVPPYMCGNSCRYRNVTTGSTVTCGPLTGSDMLTLFCIGMFEGTGDKCQSGDAPQQTSGDIGGPDAVPPADPDDPTDPANNCGPAHVWSGSTCTPVFAPDPADPGDGGGDNGGGDSGGGGNGGGGNGGGGDGSGDGSGDGDGNGDGDGGTGGGGGCGAGSCPDGGGEEGDGEPHDWYVPGEMTMTGELQKFNTRMAQAPIISQTGQFFELNVGGSCPVWSVNAWVFQVVIDQHCTASIPWELIRAVLLSSATFLAFRWAFL